MKNQLLLPDEIVKKDNQIIRTKLEIPGVEGARILAALISRIKTNEPFNPNKIYSIAVKDIIKNPDGHSYQKIKTVCKELLKSSAEIELYNDTSEEDEFIGFPFFSAIQYKKGIISAKFNFLMEKMLFKLTECFTEYSLTEYLQLSSIYSQRIFEILKSYSNLPDKEKIIPIEELHKYLSTPKSQITNFGLFQEKILKKAHKEIISKTDFYFEYEPIKGGKGGRTSPVTAVRFIFSKKKIEPVKEKKEKEDKEKTAKNNNKNFLAAWNCVKSCKGNCDTLSKKPNKAACTICKTKNLLEEVLKKQEEHCPSEKITPQKTTYKSGGIEVEQANFFEILENKNE
uniref:Initiator Rep protein WH1 domain-containing protein n=1 Tax=uncultured prokaryote TaxID=198431 RepID=A0A0H5Q6N4_9ZZZZ|nr:hypothetical protein [uncultured prokaryote]